MTKKKARKRLVRQRAAKTGESYSAALRQLLISKEKAVSHPTETPTPTASRPTQCVICLSTDDPDRTYLRAGLAICDRCDAAVRAAVHVVIDPIADEHGRPFDLLVMALVFDWRGPDKTDLRLDVHTFSPGLIIGHRGATAAALRTAIVAATGLDGLQLNVREHDPFTRSCTAAAEVKAGPS